MNKRGGLFLEFFVVLIMIIAILGFLTLIVALFSIPFLSHGSSVDVAYGVEENSFWNKLYLKDDHKTVYCIDDNRLLQIAKNASLNKQKVEVTYQEYVFRGGLCNFDDKYSGVVVRNIEVIK
jgi:hypothetical protein